MAKNKGGRPTKYRPEYCNMLIDHMAQGYSFDSFAAIIDCNTDTLYEWIKGNKPKHPQFSDAKKRGSAKRNHRVEMLYMSAAMGKTIKVKDPDTGEIEILKPNPAMMIYWTKNTLGWSDKVETIERQDGFSFVAESNGTNTI